MGYTSGWNSRRELVDHLLKPWDRPAQKNKPCAIVSPIAKFFSGNDMWVVFEERPIAGECDEAKVIESRFIVLFSMSKHKNHYGEVVWGYKDVTSSMGPCQLTCPLKFFDMVPTIDGEYDRAWRERVCELHTQKTSLKNNLKDLVGRQVKFENKIRFTSGIEADTFKVTRIERNWVHAVDADYGDSVRLRLRCFASKYSVV